MTNWHKAKEPDEPAFTREEILRAREEDALEFPRKHVGYKTFGKVQTPMSDIQ